MSGWLARKQIDEARRRAQSKDERIGQCVDGVYHAMPRSDLDVAGKIGDLVNSYLCWGSYYLPQAIIIILLVAIMIFAAYLFVKGEG
jgi:hypothetical protein